MKMPARTRTGLAALSVASLISVGTWATIAEAQQGSQADAPASVRSATAAAPEISGAKVMVHENELQSIATANGGNRAHGTTGYQKSLDYVKGKLEAAGYKTSIQQFTTSEKTGYNLIAEWPYGDANNVVMAGAHLDSVPAGPGIHDNGSGTSIVLENALSVAQNKVRPTKRIRFAWWGAEELGLIGSKHYVNQLSSTDKSKIKQYLNFDMVGSKKASSVGVYNQDATVAQHFKTYLQSKNIPTKNISWDGSSDHSSFAKAGITVGGVGTSEDDCYHRACDTTSNVSEKMLGTTASALSYTLYQLAGPVTEPSPTPTSTPTSTVTPTSTATPTTGPADPECTGATIKGEAQAGKSTTSEPYTTRAAGKHVACLTGPSGSDFDLYLQKQENGSWRTVGSSTKPQSNEKVVHDGAAGTYRLLVQAYSGSGSYTMTSSHP